MTDYSTLSVEELQAHIAKVEKSVQKAVDKVHQVVPHRGFIPNAAQRKALKLIDEGMAKGVRDFGIFLGNGVGKSCFWPNIPINLACSPEERNAFFNVDFIRNWAFPKTIRVICNAKQLKSMGAVDLALNRWLPKVKGWYQAEKNGMDYWSFFRFPNGWTMDCMTPDQPKVLHESAELGLLIVDEPIPAELWHSYAARFRHGGVRMMFATPILESYWIESDIIENPKCGHMFGDIEMNCQEHAVGGTLPHSEIERMIANYPEEEREARRSGRPIHLKGRVFDVEPDVHFVCRDDAPATGITQLVVDPHQIRPWVLTVARVDDHGDFYIIDEWPRLETEPWNRPYHKIAKDSRGVGEYAALIKQLKTDWQVNTLIIDSRFAAQTIRENYHSTNLRQKLEWEYGLYFESGNSAVRGETGGTTILKDLLSFDRAKPVDYQNKPRIFICRDLYNTTYQLQNVTRKEDVNGRVREEFDEKLFDYVRSVMYHVTHRQHVTHAEASEELTDRMKRVRKLQEERDYANA